MKSFSGNLSKEELIKELDQLSEKVESLKESEQNLRFVTDNIEDVIWRFDVKAQKLIYVTPSVQKLTGFTVEELMNERYKSIVPGDLFSERMNNFAERIKAYNSGDMSAKKHVIEIHHPSKNGGIVWIEMTTILIPDESGIVNELLGISRNITRRKEIENDLDTYKIIVDSSFEQTSVPMMLFKAPGNSLVILNTAAKEFFGIMKEKEYLGVAYEKIERTWQEFDSDGNVLNPNNIPIALACKGIHTKNKEIFIIRKDGLKKWSLVTSGPIYNKAGNLIATFMVFPEITKLKEIEDKLRKNAEELKTLNNSKDKFFSILAHDLRSPFQALLGISEILSNDIESLTQAEVVKFSGELYKAIKNQYEFLTHILEWARIQTNKIEFNPSRVNLYETVSKTFNLMKYAAEGKQIKLKADIDKSLFVKADENMLISILQNLVGNAVKFSKNSGSINISGNRVNNYYELSVSDNGVGIDEESLGRLFNFETMFSKKGTAGEKGSGLGLLICKEMIEKHGGKIWVQSNAGQGTKFTFTLPIS
jgi:PAS domain S-box-containing protein